MYNLGFVFSGQGAQFVGMAEELYKESSAARNVFEIANRVLERDVSGICFSGSQEVLNMTHNTQPCVLAADLAAYSAIKEKGIEPTCVAGFSLGEYAALVAASVISIEDAFRVIQIRADAMQEAVPIGMGAMAAIRKASEEEVNLLCEKVGGYVIAANYNSPEQIVVSGAASAVDEFILLAKEKKFRSMKIPVSAPFHCDLMEPARKKLEEVFETIEFKDARIPVYMNIDGRAHIDSDDIKKCVLAQTVSPVRWIDTIKNMNSEIKCSFVELGVGNTLISFINKICPEVETLLVNNSGTMEDFIMHIEK